MLDALVSPTPAHCSRDCGRLAPGMRTAPAMGLNVRDFKFPFLITRSPAAVFWAFVLCHSIIWTLVPILCRPNGHPDVIESLNWARHPQWGYWKHPPLTAWVTGAFVQMVGGGLWGVYLASQIAISVCFWAVWRFARDLLEQEYALISVFLLEGILSYNYGSPQFNPDILQLPLWALTVLFLWLSIHSGRSRYWLLCGLTAGLGPLSKYSIIFLFVALLVFMCVNAHARQHLGTPGPYICIAVAAVIFLPHVIWVLDNDFTTVKYGLVRAESHGRLIDHLVNPLTFGFNQALRLIPVMIMVGLLTFRSTTYRGGIAPVSVHRAFLFTVALGPFLAYLVVSAITGFQIRSGWGTPLWSFLGVFVMDHLRPALTDKALRRFSYAFLSFAAIWVILFVGQSTLGPRLTGKVNSRHFPGKSIAVYVTAQWAKQYGTLLHIVGGHQWLSENIGFYSPDRPDVYADLDSRKSPWTNDDVFNHRGGVIAWDAGRAGEALPVLWRKRFPSAMVQPAVSFAWQTSVRVPPVQIGWAIVPPASSNAPP